MTAQSWQVVCKDFAGVDRPTCKYFSTEQEAISDFEANREKYNYFYGEFSETMEMSQYDDGANEQQFMILDFMIANRTMTANNLLQGKGDKQ